MVERYFRNDYADLLHRLSNSAQLRILMLPPRVYNDGLYHINSSMLSSRVVPLVQEVATRLGAKVIDLKPIIDVNVSQTMDYRPQSVNNGGDGIHPVAEGSRAIAKAVFELIKKEML